MSSSAVINQSSTSGLVINITYDASVNNAPAGFKATVDAVVQYLESHFSDPVTISIDVGYGEVDGKSLASGSLGESSSYYISTSFAELSSKLAADGKTATDSSVIAHFPATDPTGGTYWVSAAQAKALGYTNVGSGFDGYVGFDSTAGTFDYNNSDGITPGRYDFYSVVMHEITEVMGRTLNVGQTIGSSANSYNLLDLLHYSTSGVHLFTGATAGYFSIDGGATNLANFNTDSTGDFGDWANNVGHDAFLAFSTSGVVDSVSSVDLTVMDAIGWDLISQGQTITGTTGNDTLTGTSGNDTIDASQGGNDTIHTYGGDDQIFMGAALTAADQIDGGTGTDTVTLNGDYSAGLTFGATTLVNVEKLILGGGHSYNLTTNDATVAAGQTLAVDGSALGSSDRLIFNGSAETDGSFVVQGGAGADVVVGGAGNDSIDTGAGNDAMNLSQGGDDWVVAGSGNDWINMGAALTAADHIDGGTGNDQVKLDGDYSAGLTFGATTLVNVEHLILGRGHSYNLTMNDGNVASGQTLAVDGSALGSGDSLIFNGSAETDGSFLVLGGAGTDVVVGGAGNDSINTGAGNDAMNLSQGGDDWVVAGSGNDWINMGAALTAWDHIDGGTGNDQVKLDGDYSAGLTLGPATLVNVEHLILGGGHSYNLMTNDATVAAGQTLAVDGSALGSGDRLIFNGAAETDGSFLVLGGAGADVVVGGAGNDSINTGAGNDSMNLSQGGNDWVVAGSGNDWINMGAALTSADHVDGGTGNDQVMLNGDYSAGLTFDATTLVNVEHLILGGDHSYNLTMNDGNVASGQTLAVSASALGSGDSLIFNGSAETDGSFVVQGGAGADVVVGGAGNDTINTGAGNDVIDGGAGNDWIVGGAGADTITGGSGADYFVYHTVSDSTSTSHDTITDFNASADVFNLPVTVTGIDAAVTSGALSTASFDSDLATALSGHLLAGHAELFTADSGTLAGHTFLVVDANGTAGYQAGSDFVFDITGATHLTSLGTTDFI